MKLLVMRTELSESPARAAEFITGGGTVAFPTETVYGLGADIFNEEALGAIFLAKRRPADNPLIAHIASAEQIDELVSTITDDAGKLMSSFFPGPLTLVLPKAQQVPLTATAGLNSIGVRMPAYPGAAEFLRHCGTPVAAPSANLSGRPSSTSWQAVFEDLNGRIDCILQGPDTEIGLESTVVDCTGEVPIILRAGAVSIEKLMTVVPHMEAFTVGANDTARSPGMKHRHYTPSARVIVIASDFQLDGTTPRSYIGIHEPLAVYELVKICRSPADYAHSVFSFFRESERRGIGEIYCEDVAKEGIGTALMDRLTRAAGS